MPGQIGAAQEDRRCFSGEVNEIADQVSLIVISAFHGYIHPVRALVFDDLEHTLETLNPAEKLG